MVGASARDISRWKNITPKVEGDADKFACELVNERYRKPWTKGRRWGCDWPKLWQAYGKLVNAKVNDPNAAEELGTLPDMTSWAVNILIVHRNDKMEYSLSKVGDARLGKWTSVGYAEQVVRRAGTKGVVTTLVDEKVEACAQGRLPCGS